MTVLLDANVLIALLVADHVHHEPAEAWFAGLSGSFATCPITQGSLVRLLVRDGQPAETARNVVRGVSAHPRHEFWSDDVSYSDVPTTGIVGHRQVTDAYLAQLTRAHHGRLATFDEGMAKLHHDIVDLVPVNG
jgi:toxin-antitoxin system PIN domain toxin